MWSSDNCCIINITMTEEPTTLYICAQEQRYYYLNDNYFIFNYLIKIKHVSRYYKPRTQMRGVSLVSTLYNRKYFVKSLYIGNRGVLMAGLYGCTFKALTPKVLKILVYQNIFELVYFTYINFLLSWSFSFQVTHLLSSYQTIQEIQEI